MGNRYKKLKRGQFIQASLANLVEQDLNELAIAISTHQHTGLYLEGDKLTKDSFVDQDNYPDFISIPFGTKYIVWNTGDKDSDNQYYFVMGNVFYYKEPYTDLSMHLSAFVDLSQSNYTSVRVYVNFYPLQQDNHKYNNIPIYAPNDYGVMQLVYKGSTSTSLMTLDSSTGSLSGYENQLIAAAIYVKGTSTTTHDRMILTASLLLERP